ncbi:hypothetical protein BRD13_03235 [Halobacteriales archaeon SW_5_70_135]|nr:MAG: hypothetical protein BRD13_03235 [Halobacteriales archaeon SW_5_70_135]
MTEDAEDDRDDDPTDWADATPGRHDDRDDPDEQGLDEEFPVGQRSTEGDAGVDTDTEAPRSSAPDSGTGGPERTELDADVDVDVDRELDVDANATDRETAPSGTLVDDDDADRVPMAGLAEEVSDRELAGDEGLFEQKQRPEIDREALWRQVTDEETAEEAVERLDVDGEGRHTGRDASDVGERVVEKSMYCQGCRYMSPPPNTHCTHEGTEIVEAVDMDHFRVRNCPVVAENEELEEF